LPTAGLPPTRRSGGARRETSDRVRFTVGGEREVEGWALNLSRGGLRAILDEAIELGTEVEVSIAEQPSRLSRIVWIQEEPDGAIVGVEFLDIEGPASVPPEPPREEAAAVIREEREREAFGGGKPPAPEDQAPADERDPDGPGDGPGKPKQDEPQTTAEPERDPDGPGDAAAGKS
jgi:hypothetical protein